MRPAFICRSRPLLGTFVEISVRAMSAEIAHAAIDDAFGVIGRVQRTMSRFDPDSDVARLNRDGAALPVVVDAATFSVLSAARRLAELSAGAFDVTGGRWQRLRLLPGRRVTSAVPLDIDLGGIAKGYAVDCAVLAVRRHPIAAVVVNAGGDLRVWGDHALPIRLRHPADSRQLVDGGLLRNEALATSARYADRCGQGRVAGRIAAPPGYRLAVEPLSISVAAPTCLLADALTKVLMVAGPAQLDLVRRLGARASILTAKALYCDRSA